jgi:hypothetical protein
MSDKTYLPGKKYSYPDSGRKRVWQLAALA